MKKQKIGLGVIIAILLIIAAGFSGLVTFATDFLWFKELGYISVFFKQLFTQLQIGIPTFVIILILANLYLMMLKRGYYKRIETVDSPAVSEKTLGRISFGLSAAFAVIVTAPIVSELWFEILKFKNSTDFNIKDPIYNLDVSFYVFRLHFVNQINQFALGIVVAFAILTLVYYFILLSLRRPKIFEGNTQNTGFEEDQQEYKGGFSNTINGMFGETFEKFGQGFNGGQNTRPFKQKKQFNNDNFKELIHIASNQLVVLGIIFFFMVASNFFLRQFDLLYSHTGVLYGAGFTDVSSANWISCNFSIHFCNRHKKEKLQDGICCSGNYDNCRSSWNGCIPSCSELCCIS